MRRHLSSVLIGAAGVIFGLCCHAADAPRIGPAVSAIGPLVDVTLKTGESNKGQLVSYADGSLSLRLDNGSVITRDGESVVSIRFIAPEKPAAAPAKTGIPSAQETELTTDEMIKFSANRWREISPKNALNPRPPVPPLSEKEDRELSRIRDKAKLHMEALEVEIPLADSVEVAQSKLSQLARESLFYGHSVPDVRTRVRNSALSIKNNSIRHKVETDFVAYWDDFLEKHNKGLGKRAHEKMLEREKEKKDNDNKPPVPPEKPPVKPAPKAPDAK